MNRKILFPIIIIAVLFTAGCKSSKDKASTSNAKEEQATTFAVSTALAVQGELKDYLELNGDIAARSTVDTYADTAGK